MKKIYILFVTLAVIITGCSSIYSLKDFPTKQKFYNNFNNFAKNKNVKVTLNNDSSFTTSSGAIISNDTLFRVTAVKKNEIKLNYDRIKGIKNYNTLNYMRPVYKVTLKNGKELKAVNLKMLPHSMIDFSILKNIYGSPIPINRIKKISYKNHWLGAPVGLIAGTATGFGAGLLLAYYLTEYKRIDNGNSPGFYEILGGTAIGTIAGAVWGWIDGYTYIYQFNH